MTGEDHRGEYVARESTAARLVTKWHFVDTQVLDSVVTYCGRPMERNNAKGTLTFATGVTDSRICLTCAGGNPPK